jgi:hypothetical protein
VCLLRRRNQQRIVVSFKQMTGSWLGSSTITPQASDPATNTPPSVARILPKFGSL